jgi:hypothetical protein
MFFISIHSPVLAPGEPIHAISLKIICRESGGGVAGVPADACGKENEHDGVVDNDEGVAAVATGSTTAS